MKATGTKGESTSVSARLIIGKTGLSSERPELKPLDKFIAAYPEKTLNYYFRREKVPPLGPSCGLPTRCPFGYPTGFRLIETAMKRI